MKNTHPSLKNQLGFKDRGSDVLSMDKIEEKLTIIYR